MNCPPPRGKGPRRGEQGEEVRRDTQGKRGVGIVVLSCAQSWLIIVLISKSRRKRRGRGSEIRCDGHAIVVDPQMAFGAV